MTFDSAPEVAFEASVFRIDRYNDPRAIAEMAELSPEQKVQLIRYAELPVLRQRETIARIFVPWSTDPPYSAGRFGDGRFPVLYCALEQSTAIEEKLFHLRKADWFARYGYPVAYNVFVLDVKAQARDLRQSSYNRDELISEDYSLCRDIGALAKASGVKVILSYSARSDMGTTAPILSATAIGNVTVSGNVELDSSSAGFRLIAT